MDNGQWTMGLTHKGTINRKALSIRPFVHSSIVYCPFVICHLSFVIRHFTIFPDFLLHGKEKSCTFVAANLMIRKKI